jgi:hypothetical protein
LNPKMVDEEEGQESRYSGADASGEEGSHTRLQRKSLNARIRRR